MPDPPLRLFLGDGPLDLIRTEYASRIATWEKYARLSLEAHGSLAGNNLSRIHRRRRNALLAQDDALDATLHAVCRRERRREVVVRTEGVGLIDRRARRRARMSLGGAAL
jgi:hypothetical protein